MKIKLKFPDGNEKEYDKGIKGMDIANEISKGLARNAVAIELNKQLIDLNYPIKESGDFKIITLKDSEGVDILRHSTAHLMAQAIKRLYPETLLTIGPVVEEGYYYDVAREPFKPEELEKIEEEMKKIVKENFAITREEISKKEALELFKHNKYKLEMIKELEEGTISIYKQGEFFDLCRGPHLPRTGMIKAFKLLKVSSSYWRANAENDALQRIYGIAFPEKNELKEYLQRIEEAIKRDHRKIGRELNLYSFHEEAPGMPFFHDGGSFIWNKLVEYTTELMNKRNYEINKTPIILNKSLWLQSGHWDHYKNDMYFTTIDNQDYAIKPMNCPGNILIYKTTVHSYRELPIKAGEFGLVHRNELSGVLSGLFRVRCFTQDDAHVFCTPEQIEEQIKELIGFMDELYSKFGFKYSMELSTRPDDSMGDPKLWELAESKLKKVLDKTKKEYSINEGDGAFYGPKIDFHIKDALGRSWQCGTIQLDFQMPEKFNLTYEGSDGSKHRPVMIHRAVLGSVERFMGILVEHYAGKLPFWISPNQVKILPIADRHNDFCDEIAEELHLRGIRVQVDKRTESTNRKIRDAQLQKYNYILVIGDKEVADNMVNIRHRGEILGTKPYKKFIEEINNKNLKKED